MPKEKLMVSGIHPPWVHKTLKEQDDLLNLLSHWNNPSPLGHHLISRELTAWFPAR